MKPTFAEPNVSEWREASGLRRLQRRFSRGGQKTFPHRVADQSGAKATAVQTLRDIDHLACHLATSLIARSQPIVLLVAILLMAGCGEKVTEAHEEEVPAGASFKASKGVVLTEEMRNTLGVEVADVTEQKLPAQIRFNVQVFGEKHHPAIREDDHTGCDVHASGVLSPDKATTFRTGQPVQIQTSAKELFAGVVLAVEKAVTLDENEIILGITNAAAKLKPGDFLSAIITLPREQSVTVVPNAALLHSVDGTFVYAVNGDAYFRTAVKVGAEANGFAEITDGLLAGDQVVTKSLSTLWLIELRATKGGAGCCHP